MIKNNKIKVVIGMSGGVDSSVAAALLKKQGYFVIGVFMKFWKEGQSKENRCCSVESEKLARLVAKKISIPFYVVNVEKEFKKKVVDYFINEYRAGNTPNPCVVCNKEIKFGFLIKKALLMGADFVATGHYAAIKNGKLLKGKDKEKDQSYFLWQLDKKQLDRILFPLSGYTKTQVRSLAKKFGLATAKTPESQEICFVQNTANDFLKKYIKAKPGKAIDEAGKVLGRHQGLCFYTIGQRKGLKIDQGSAFAKSSGETKPYYVVSKDSKNNNLIISKKEKALEGRELVAGSINWILPQKLPLSCQIKIRYRSKLAKARILKYKKNNLKIIFQKPQRAITSGQSAVFYKGNHLLGGGVIQ